MTWKDFVSWLGIILSLVMAHHVQPAGTDVFIVVLLIIFIWQVIDWNFMSAERRAALVAKYKTRHGIPQHQPHKVDSFLRK
jgi:hypothetical protein